MVYRSSMLRCRSGDLLRGSGGCHYRYHLGCQRLPTDAALCLELAVGSAAHFAKIQGSSLRQPRSPCCQTVRQRRGIVLPSMSH